MHKSVIILLSATLLASATDAQIVTNTFNSSGNFTVPLGVTQVTVQAWGGGGGGATRGTNGVGGGGGGGAYSRGDVSVVPQQTYTVTVGAGGAANTAGQDSWFGTAGTLMAKGGSGGTNNSATGAAGGLASASVGTTKFNGGTGGTGSGTNAGGGGSSAGTAAAGGNGGVPAGGVAPTGGGAGGAGRSGTQGDGNPGVGHGGAGGGGYRSSSGTRLGGAGLAGRVIITYTVPPPGPPSKLVFATAPRTANIEKSTSLITVQLQDVNNNIVPSSGTTVINLSSSGTGEFWNATDNAVITSVSIPNGNTEASFRYRAPTVGSRTLTVAATGLTSANQSVTIVDLPPVAQTFYLPLPEDQLLTSLNTIASAAVTPVINRISLAVLSDNTVIYYDQYENGYEADLSNPAGIYDSVTNPAGTQIWGDGNTANGVPPGVPSDILDSGTVIVLSASVPVPIPNGDVYYGGRDKIGASKAISVVRVGWASSSNTLLAGANEIFDTSNWGTLFRAPVGNNIADGTDFQMFEYAGFLVMAGRGGANIQIDADANGSFELGPIALVEGQSYHVNNGVNAGARVSSDNPVQVDLITGDVGSNYESRFMKLLPVGLWSNSYVTPVSTPSTAGSQTGTDTTVWLYNPGSSNLSVTYRVRTSASNISTTTLTVPGGAQGGFLKQVLPDTYGAAFSAASPFYAVSTTDSNSGNADGTGNQAWDWGFTLVPQSSLSPQVLVGLGIGRDPTSGTNPDENGNPVWVTPLGNGNTPVTIYVDYDADPLTGPLTDPNGFKYDTSVSLRELERAKLYDANDRDQTGMLLYTLTSGVKLAAAWGQDPLVASAGAPGLDMGTGVPPLPLFTATKSSALDADNDQDTFISPGDRLLYTINIANSSRAPVSDMTLTDILPPGTTYVPNSTFFTDDANVTVQIADDGAGTAFPLDDAGKLLPDPTIAVGGTWKVVFKVLINDFVNLPSGQTQILNEGTASAENSTVPFSTIDPLYGRIGDFVWNDSNGNGIQDGSELGFSGVTVRLYDGSNNLLATQNTQANGSYLFTGLLAGNYQVRFTTPAGFTFSPQNADSLGLAGTVNSDANPSTGFTSVFALAPGQPITHVDAGMRCGDFTITCPPNLTQNCASVNLSTNVTGAATVVSACNCPLTIVYSDTVTSSCASDYVVTRVWTATDNCGSFQQCVQTITVEDNTAPVLSGQGGPETIQCPATPSFTAPTATDACDATPTITFADVTTPGDCPAEYAVTRTWTATDDCGNSSQVSQTITVEDTTAPVLSGQGGPETIQCPATPSFTAPTATDACDTAPTITFADVTTPGDCPAEYAVTRTWTATDDCGNSSQVSQTITVEDTTAPVLSGQGGPETIQCPATPSFTAPTATDACDATPTITFADVTTPGDCPAEYAVTRTWTATDDCGNSSQVSQTITVEDTTAPVLSGQGGPETIQCPATPSFTAPTATDACDTAPTITFADVTTPGDCPAEYAVTRTWTATDDCGNSSQVSQTITVEDTTAPVLSGQGGPETIQCPATPSFTAPTATDACDATPTITFADVTTPGDCPAEYAVTRTWTATDDCGNSSQVSQTITVEDTTAPVLSGQGAAETIQCPATPSFTAPTATDLCDTTPTVTFADATTPGDCPAEYAVTRTWTATDDCGNSSQVSQTITVEDTTAPVLSGQGAAETIQCPATPSFTAPTATDLCDTTPTITFADVTTPGDCPAEYAVTRTWTATDDCGNSSQVSQTITVEDTTAPVLSGQGAAETIQCPATPSFTAPTATDLCDATPTITFADVTTPGDCLAEYAVTRTWTATDDCGNSSQVSQTITVEDTTAPVLSGQGAAETIQCPATPSFTAPTATDLCDATPTITFADVTTPGDCPAEYAVTRTWTATDDCGNSSQVSQTITVEDTTAPVLSGQGAAETIQCPALPSFTAPTALDACDTTPTITFNDVTTPGDCPAEYAVTRTWTTTDDCGNSSQVSQTITVEDTTPPVILCPADIILQGDGLCNAEVPLFTPTSSDACSPVTVTQNPPAGTIITGPGDTIVTLTSTDACGNAAQCTVRITISCRSALGDLVWLDKDRDGIQDASETNGVENVTVILRDGVTLAAIATNTTSAAGIYGFVDLLPDDYVLEVVPPPGYAFSPVNASTNTLIDSDIVPATGRSLSFFLPGNVTDLSRDAGLFCLAPVITCPPDVDLECPASTTTNATGVATATSPCGCAITITYSDTTVPGCGNTLILTRTWTATDNCGNTSACVQTITVEDTTDPVISGVGPAATIECDQPVVFSTPTATDACDTTPTITFSDVTTPGTCPQKYAVTRTWTATDACGNVSTASQVITVQDSVRPVLSGVPGPGSYLCDNIPSPPPVTASDNCDNDVPVALDIQTFPGPCSSSYTIVRTWTAIDACGNERSLNQTLTIVDTTAPILSGQGGPATIECPATPSFTAPTALDACDTTPTITFADVTTPGDCPQKFAVTRTWTATDDCGNSSQVSQTITVQDTTDPVISGVGPAATIECDQPIVFSAPTASDNCDPAPTLTFSDSTLPGSCPQNFVRTRTWTATDACGNVSTASQAITVQDTTDPVISGVGPAATIECDQPIVFSAPTASDNCDPAPTLTFSDSTLPGSCPQNFVRTRTWTATDACGNVSTASQAITVQDTTDPVISGVGPAATIECDQPIVFSAPTASDNCDPAPTLTFSDSTLPGSCSQNFVRTRTWTATDACGNVSTASQAITVQDTTDPVISGVGPAATIECDQPIVFSAPTASDNCDPAPTLTFSDSTLPGSCPQNFVRTRTWTATDACGNVSTASQAITVQDTTDPVISGVGPAATIECDQPIVFSAPTASDNCDPAPTLTFSDSTLPGSCPQNFVRTRTWTATDACGNVSTASQAITVQDTTDPVISGVGPAATIECDQPIVFSAPTASDNCDPAPTLTFSDSTLPGSCPQNFVRTRTWTATDACGNVSTASQAITVQDTTDPVISGVGPAATIECDQPIVFSAPTASDNCDPAPTLTFSDSTLPGSCPQNFVRTRTWTATDACGNVSTASQAITVQDTTDPVISGVGPAATIECDQPIVFSAPTASDNCDPAPTLTFSDSTLPGSCPQNFVRTRTWTATDACGNVSTASQAITVHDTTDPVISGVGPAATIECDQPIVFSAPTASDNCDPAPTLTFSDSTLPGSCPQNFVRTRTWTATDACGNVSTASQAITVRDTLAPTLSGQGSAATIQCPATPSFTAPTAADACDTTPTITFADVTTPGTCPQKYAVTRTWTATDDCGNSSQVSQTITVEDTTAPTITCPAPVTVNCISLVPQANPALVTASDLCGSVTVIHVGDTSTGTDCNRVITRTYRATDACGNSATCTQTITVIDNVRPVQTGFLQDRVFQCVASLNAFTPTPPVVVDNCGGTLPAPTPAILNNISAVNCSRTRRYIWTFRDACGNQLRITQTLFVRDTGRPTITCPAPLTLQGDAECKAVLPALVPVVTDNCGAGGVTVTQSPPAGTILTGPGSTTVTLTARDACGNTATCPATVTVNCGTPAIELVKTVYPGHDAGVFCPGAELVISTNNAPVTYCFEVKNTGALNLINVVLEDNTLGMPAINVGSLAVGQSRMFSADALITANFTNVAQVAGTSVTGVPVSDSDDAAVGKIRPQIQIVKTVAYGDNAPCPGQNFIYAVNGQPVTYCFVVTNLGDVPLRQVVITDDDIGMSPIPLGDLAVGQSKPAKISVIANGNLTNTAWTVGLPPVGPPVTDDDPAEILALGPAVKFGKTAYTGHDGGARCPGGDLALINGPNTPVTFCFEVENSGDETLYNVEVSDPALGFNSVVGTLNPGQSVLLHAQAFLNGPVTNVARVTVLPPSGGAFFVDDEAYIDSARPEIRIDKTVAAGYGGYSSCVLNSVETLNLPAPGAVTYCFKVRNTGNTHLNNLAINDLNLGIQEFDMEYVGPAFPLPPGAEAMYMVKAFASSTLINQVQTTAVPTDAQGANIPGFSGVGDVDQAEVIIPVQP